MAELSIFNVSVKDDASAKIVRITKKLESMQAALKKQVLATKLSADQMTRYDAAMAGANAAEIKLIESMQQQVAASKKLAMEEQERIASAIAAEKQLEQTRSQALQSNVNAIDMAAASQKKKQQADQKAQQATNNLVASLRDEAATYGMTRDQIEIYRLEQSKASAAQIQSVKAAQLNRDEQIKLQKASQGVTKHLRFMRGGFGQVGYQIQDMAVQAQMGTNSMIILGQQGSQVASLFGPGGAMIGAILAVVAALSTVLIPNLFGASKAMKKVEDDQKKLIENFDKLDAVLRKTALADAEQQIANFESTIKDANEILKINIDLSERWQKITDSGVGSTEDNEKAQKQFNKAIDEQRVIIKIAAKNINELKEKTNGQANAANKLVEKLQLSTKQFNYSDKQMAEYEATQAGATGGTKNLIVYLKLLEIALAKKKEKDDEATQAIKDNQKAVNDMNVSLAEEIAMFGKSATEIAVRNAALKGATSAEQEAIRALAEHKQGLIDKDKADKEAAETAIEKKKSLDEMVSGLKDELAQTKLSATGILLYNAAKLGADDITLQRIKNLGDELVAEELLKTKREDAAKSFADLQISSIEELETPAQRIQREYEEKIAKIVEYEALANAVQAEADAERLAAQQIFTDKSIKLHDDIAAAQLAATSSVLSSFQSQISGMAGFLEEGSAIGKAFFVAQQAMAAGMAIIKGYEAAASITAAMAMMGPAGVAAAPAMATAAISMGYVTAAMIAGQTLASFEGGGHVGGRSRSGGMDNKGGVLAMLHPNESVIDHTKGQSGGITIINNIDAGGAGADVDMKIRQAVTQATTASVATIQDLMRRRRFA